MRATPWPVPTFFKGLEMVAARHNLPYFAMGRPGQAVTFRSTQVYAYMPKDFAAYEADPLHRGAGRSGQRPRGRLPAI